MWRPNSSPPSKAASPSRPGTPAKAPSAIPPREPAYTSGASIGRTFLIKGEISGEAPIYLDGQVEGTIKLPGSEVQVGPNGKVQADVTAKDLVVSGQLSGKLTVGGRLHLLREAAVTGKAVTRRLSMQEGASFKGKIVMEAERSPEPAQLEVQDIPPEEAEPAIQTDPALA